MNKTFDRLLFYSQKRLLGNHVPYAIESYPEGNGSHLSAESALYCRVYTEGLFGISTESFHSFTCCPRLPKNWNEMMLKSIKAFGVDFDLLVTRKDNESIKIAIRMKNIDVRMYYVKENESVLIELPE